MRVPQIKIIVMHALDHEEARAGIVINLRERGGIKLGRIPIAQDFLVTGLGWMAKLLEVIFVGAGAGRIELARIPVAALAGGLRAEVNPDAELRLAQPPRFAGIILLDGFPCRLERPGRNRNIQLHFWKRFHVAHRHAVLRLWRRNSGDRRKRGVGRAAGDCRHQCDGGH